MSDRLRTASGAAFRTTSLIEIPVPIELDPEAMPGAIVLGEDGKAYQSSKLSEIASYTWNPLIGEAGDIVFADDLTVDTLTVNESLSAEGADVDLTGATITADSSGASLTNFGFGRLATDEEVLAAITGTPIVDGPVLVQPEQLSLVLTRLNLLEDTQSILYVDGGISYAIDGYATHASIPTAIWTDIKANISVHGIDTWTGTAPDSGSEQSEFARRVVFKNITDVFAFVNSRRPISRSEIRINLYGSSDSNTGAASNTAVTSTYSNESTIVLSKGPSQSALSGKRWGAEHFTGCLSVPNGKLRFEYVNVNGSGRAGSPDIQVTNARDFVSCLNVEVVASRLKFHTNRAQYGSTLIFADPNKDGSSIYLGGDRGASQPTVDDVIELDLYSAHSGATRDISQIALRTTKMIVESGHRDSTALKLDIIMGQATALSTTSTFAIAKNLLLDFSDGSVGSASEYGGINLSLSLAGQSTATIFDVFSSERINIEGSESSMAATVADEGSITTSNSLNYQSFPGVYVIRSRSGGSNILTSLMSKTRDAFVSAGVSSGNAYAWRIAAGSFRDGLFLTAAESFTNAVV